MIIKIPQSKKERNILKQFVKDSSIKKKSLKGKKIKVIAPWREWKLQSRSDLIKYAKKYKIPIPKDKEGAPPFSVDDNLFHVSTEGKVLENPRNAPPEFIFQKTISPEKAKNKAIKIKIGFKNIDPVSINGKKFIKTLLDNSAVSIDIKDCFKMRNS